MSEPAPEPWTVLKLLDWTKGFFERQDVHAPRLSAEVLLAHALGYERVMLYARYDYQPTDEQTVAFRELVRRAGEHEPVAYLVGQKEFYSLSFVVTPDVLVPRPETEALVGEAVGHLKQLPRPGRMWDVCTGSGCVAVAAAHMVPDLVVLATDISGEAVAVAEQNVQRHGLSDRVRCRTADLLALPDDCADLLPLDVITGNPPYVLDGCEVAPCVEREPAIALFGGPEGLTFMRKIIRDAPALLAEGGKLILEFGMEQGDDVRDLVIDTDAFHEPVVLRDHQELERTIVATRL